MTDKPTITIDSIPMEALVEARHALADEYLILKFQLEQSTFMARMHRKRTEARIMKKEKYLVQLDAWIERVKR